MWHNDRKPFHGGYLAKSIQVENEAEALIALQAIETYRALQQAVKTAPHGKGLVTVEAVVHDKGFEHLRTMYQSALQDHPEAQKKGPAL
jgi:phage-related protein